MTIMKTVKTNRQKATKRQVGLRLRSELADEIIRLAQSDDRQITWVMTKIVEAGLPIVRKSMEAS